MSNKDATPAGKIDSQKVPMLYASSEKVLSDETATTLQISHRSYTGELWILLGYTIALSVLFRERSSRRKIYLSVNGSVKMRGKCGVYALRDFHEMLASKSLVFLMTVSALGKRNQHSTIIIRLCLTGDPGCRVVMMPADTASRIQGSNGRHKSSCLS